MTTLKQIKGTAIQFLDADPVEYAGSWSSGGSINTARGQIAGFGNTSAAGAAMGTTGSIQTLYEQYDGTSWTETTDINTAGRNGLGTGTTTAGLIYGGWPRAGKTESWNGSAWTELGDMTRGANGSQSQAGGGTQTAAFAAGGEPGTTYSRLAEIWNGTSWTEVNDLNTLRVAAMGFVITTAGYVAGGYSPPVGSPGETDNVEVYNGSSWTETTNINTKRGVGGGAGNATSGIIFGGQTPSASALTESWNGSAWTEVGDLTTARYQAGKTVNPSSGSTDAMFIGGENPGYLAVSEEWSFPPITATTLNEGDMWFNSSSSVLKGYGVSIPTGTWSSGGTMNTARNGLRGAGISQDSALAFGGGGGAVVTESYNGTSWTEVNDLSTSVNVGVGVGTQGAARAAVTTTNQGWDGTSWSEENNLNTSRQEIGSLGTKASCLAIGNQNGASAIVEQWDGTSWTEVGDLTTAAGSSTGIGTTSAGRSVGGWDPPTYLTVNQFWNGTSWSEEADINTGRYYAGGSGTSDLGLIFGGYGPVASAKTEVWNGTSWTEINDLATATNNAAPAPSSPAGNALFAGGATPPNTAKTEEWTAVSAVLTVTTS